MESQKMKAIVSTKYGGPEIFQLQMVDKPSPKKNEVLIKIHAASVTTAETMMRTGYPLIGRLFMGLTKPKNNISGTGFAGEIIELGAEVTMFEIGDKVFGESLESFGTYAEYVCVSETGIITKKPESISYEEAAVVGDGPITSWNFLKKVTNLRPEQSILIIGASGSLGSAAVQIAKQVGAHVTGVCSGRKLEMVHQLGADQVIDYIKNDFTKNGEQYDIIYDTVGKSSFSKCKNSLNEKGEYLFPTGGFIQLLQVLKTSFSKGKKARFSATGMLPVSTIREILFEIKELMSTKKITNIIDKRYSLEQTAEAHRYIDNGHKRGNVVISF